MPALRSCSVNGCRELTWTAFCEEHRPAPDAPPRTAVIPPPAPAPPLAAPTPR